MLVEQIFGEKLIKRKQENEVRKQNAMEKMITTGLNKVFHHLYVYKVWLYMSNMSYVNIWVSARKDEQVSLTSFMPSLIGR